MLAQLAQFDALTPTEATNESVSPMVGHLQPLEWLTSPKPLGCCAKRVVNSFACENCGSLERNQLNCAPPESLGQLSSWIDWISRINSEPSAEIAEAFGGAQTTLLHGNAG